MAPIVGRRGVFTMQQCNCRASAALAILARQADNHLCAPQAPHFIQFPKSACDAVVPRRFPVTIGHMKKSIFTSEAPAAIGPYSQGIRTERFLFCSGQIPLDPKSGEIVSGDIATQTRRVMDNVAALLRTEGLTFDHVVKTTIFLTNLGDFQAVNEIYGSYFKQDPPARSTVQVSALPRGANVEIEVIAAAAEADQAAYDTSG
jgi:2-iminobutanoate/2-iminopropanoate deaminase